MRTPARDRGTGDAAPQQPEKCHVEASRSATAGPGPCQRPEFHHARLRDRADRHVQPIAAPARVKYPARHAGCRANRPGQHCRSQTSQRRRADGKWSHCRSVARKDAVPAAAIRRRSPCCRWRRAMIHAARRPACGSVRDWRGWRDRSPWWCRRPRVLVAIAAGACRPVCDPRKSRRRRRRSLPAATSRRNHPWSPRRSSRTAAVRR